jgi:hypothetical protein
LRGTSTKFKTNETVFYTINVDIKTRTNDGSNVKPYPMNIHYCVLYESNIVNVYPVLYFRMKFQRNIWLSRISSFVNVVGVYVGLPIEFSIPNSFIRLSKTKPFSKLLILYSIGCHNQSSELLWTFLTLSLKLMHMVRHFRQSLVLIRKMLAMNLYTNNTQGMQLGRFENRTPARFEYIYCTLFPLCHSN